MSRNLRLIVALPVVGLLLVALGALAQAEEAPVNLALGKPAVASSVQRLNPSDNFPAASACDGRMDTRWGSAYKDGEWVYIDLGSKQRFNVVILKWEIAYALSYKIQVSDEARDWTDVYTVARGHGGTERVVFEPVEARYVRMYATLRATEWGVSLWEFEVYYLPDEKASPTPQEPLTGAQLTQTKTAAAPASSRSDRKQVGQGVALVDSALTSKFYGQSSYDTITGSVKLAMQEAGISLSILSDEDVEQGKLLQYKVAVLPSNPIMTDGIARALGDFVALGGRIFTSYETSARNQDGKFLGKLQLEDVLGVKLVRWDAGKGRYAYIKVLDPNHPIFQGMPDFIPMTREMTFVAEALPQAKVLGEWYDSDKKTKSQPDPQTAAIIVTDNTVYVGDCIFDKANQEDLLRRFIVNVVKFLGGEGLSLSTAKVKIDEARQAIEKAEGALAEAREQLVHICYGDAEAMIAQAKSELGAASTAYSSGDLTKAEELAQSAADKARVAAYRTIESRPAETRGCWLDNGTLAKLCGREDAAHMLDQLAKINVNVIYPETIYRGYAIYRSAIAPKDPRFDSWTEDPLEVLAEEAHKRGMEVHPWVWVFCVGYWHDEGPVLRAHQDWAEKDKDGNIFSSWVYGTAWLSSTLPDVRGYLMDEFTEIVTKYKVDGIHLDYIRYNEQGAGVFGFSDHSVAEFQSLYGIDLKQISRGTQEELTWHLWREYNVTSFVERVKQELKALRPDLKISAAVVPDPGNARLNTLQNWKHWLENQYIDFLNTMAYTENLDDLDRLVDKALDASSNRVCMYPGLAVWLNEPDRLLQQISLVRQKGAPGIILFALAHMKDDYYQALGEGPFRIQAIAPHRDPIEAATVTLKELASRVAFYRGASALTKDEADAIILDISAAEEATKGLGTDTAKIQAGIDSLAALSGKLSQRAPQATGKAALAYGRVAADLSYIANILRIMKFGLSAAEYVPPEDPPIVVGVPQATAAATKQKEAASSAQAAAGGEANLALAKSGTTVEVDSCFSGYSSKPLNDGERNDQPEEGRWAEVAWASAEIPTEHWIVINLPEKKAVHRVDIYWALDREKYWSSQRYVIQYWDGAQWIDIYGHEDKGWRTTVTASSVSFLPIETNKIRVFQPQSGGPAKRPNLMWVAEIEVY